MSAQSTSDTANGTLAARAGSGGSSRLLASLLLAGGVSALVVLAEQGMSRWAESHELASWLVLWGVAVLSIMLLRGLTRLMARQAIGVLDAWSAQLARQRADERLWAMAQTDPRLMTDLQRALDRDGQHRVRGLSEPSRRPAPRRVREQLHYL